MKVRNLRTDEISYYRNLFQNEIYRDTSHFARYLNTSSYPRGFYLDSPDDSVFVFEQDAGFNTRPSTGEEYNIGIRPVIEYNDEELDMSKLKTIIIDGIEYVEFGYYPQNYIGRDLQIIYEERIKSMPKEFEILLPNYYSTLNRLVESDKKPKSKFKFFKHKVLGGYHSKKYVRFLSNRSTGFFQNIETNTNVIWFEVEPIRWMLDRENNLLIANKILLTGIPYKTTNHDLGNMEYYTLANYLNNVFFNEIQGKPAVIKNEHQDKIKEVKKVGRKKMVKSSPVNFDFSSVSEEDMIKGAILSDVPVFLHGKSGDGKSDRVEALDPNLEVLYMRNASPESLIGKSIVLEEKEELIDVPPTWYLRLCEKCQREPDKIHILFFDELTNALPSIQSMAFNIILDKEVNGKWKLPKNVRIVAAGNEVEDSLTSYGLAEPLYGRFAHVYIKTIKEDWIKWAIEKQIHPMIIAYISSMGDKVLRTKYTGMEPNADPRKWEMASRVLYKTKNPELLRELIGDALTTEFIAFCFSPVITLEDVLNNNYIENMVKKMNMSLKYATLVGLSGVDIEHFDIVYDFVKLMKPELTHLFEVLWCKNDTDKLEYLLIKKQEKVLTKKVGI